MSKLWPAVALSLLFAAPATAQPPNIVLVVVDALRPDHLTPYGYARDTSPRLAKLAGDGVVFTNAYSASNWTLPALSSLMTGLYPSAHGAMKWPKGPDWPKRLFEGKYVPPTGGRLPESRRTLAAVLAARGYRTAGIVSGGICRSAFGFSNGFQSYYDGAGALADLMPRVVSALSQEPGRPFFLYVHDDDVHSPYKKGPDFDSLWDPGYEGPVDGSRKNVDAIDGGELKLSERDARHLVALYDGGISYTDRPLGVLLDALKDHGLAENTIVVVTADHGEAFGEHGVWTHGQKLYEEIVRVPLIIRLPGGARGLRVDVPVSGVDLLPTIAAAAGAEVPREAQGRSLLSALKGGRLERADVYAEDSEGEAAVRSGSWKYVEHSDGSRLYDLASDPGESVDLAARRPEVARRLAGRLRGWRARMPRGVADEGLKKKLEAAGYEP